MTSPASDRSAPRPAQGMRLGGRYELRSRIAVGGMGEVWVSQDLSLGRSVATKLLRPELAGDDRFLARLRAEARTSAPLAHPNIAALYDYGEDDGAGYLVMELVAGEPLADVLAREHVLAPDALLPILAQTARALHAAHVCGIVHRDIKPSNILLTPDGRVKITDFGISVAANDAATSARGTVLGTAQYLAPEQAMGRPVTPACDIYALGVVAYEALAGRRPFTGRTLAAIARAHVTEPVPDLPGFVPEAVRGVVLSMLAKDPERRPRSAASLARTLERIAKELELARPFDATPERTGESGRHAHEAATRDHGRHRLVGGPSLWSPDGPSARITAERGGVIHVTLPGRHTEDVDTAAWTRTADPGDAAPAPVREAPEDAQPPGAQPPGAQPPGAQPPGARPERVADDPLPPPSWWPTGAATPSRATPSSPLPPAETPGRRGRGLHRRARRPFRGDGEGGSRWWPR